MAPTTALAPFRPSGFSASPLCLPEIYAGFPPTIHSHISIVTLAWDDKATNENGYRIYRDGALVDTLAADSTSYIDSPPNDSHAYEVEAFNAAGSSARRGDTASCS